MSNYTDLDLSDSLVNAVRESLKQDTLVTIEQQRAGNMGIHVKPVGNPENTWKPITMDHKAHAKLMGISEGLDPVSKLELKKKFSDRKDKDIDNDGDSDESDRYLHKRRKAISKKNEKAEQVDLEPSTDEEPGQVKEQAGELLKKQSEIVEKFGVYMKGGSIGSKETEPLIFDDEKKAKDKAKRLNKLLSPGEKKFYRIKYVVKAIKEEAEELDEGFLKKLAQGAVDKIDDAAASKFKNALSGSNAMSVAVDINGMPSKKRSDIKASIGRHLKRNPHKELERLHSMIKEEQIDELSRKKLGQYVKASKDDLATKSVLAGMTAKTDEKETLKTVYKAKKRSDGINRAVDKMTKEESTASIIGRFKESLLSGDE